MQTMMASRKQRADTLPFFSNDNLRMLPSVWEHAELPLTAVPIEHMAKVLA